MRHYTLYNRNISRLVAVLLTLLLLCSVPTVSAAEASGSCGSNLNWSLSGDTLTITGSGAMDNFPESTMAPWYEYRAEIARVQLPEGLTRIGNLAFYECAALEFVSMPDSVTEVGWYAFAGCNAMTMLDLSSSLQVIEDGAFQACSALPAVRLPGTLTKIGERAFYRCESLKEITIPASVGELGICAFSFCYDLVRADIQASITKLPFWTFYGCGKLTTLGLPATVTGADEFAFYDCYALTNVVYSGSDENKQQIEADIGRDRNMQIGEPQPDETDTPDTPSTPDTPDTSGEDTPNRVHIVDKTPESPASSTKFDDDGKGNLTGTTTITTETENASVSAEITVTYSQEDGNPSIAQVTVTLETADALGEISDHVTEIVNNADEAFVDVYIKDDTALEGDALKNFRGREVTVTIHNVTGAVWKIDCSGITARDKEIEFDLSYERLDATDKQLELMNCTVGYQIKFQSNAQVDAEVMIKLPVENARKSATFFQKKLFGDIEILQTVMVDDAGYAHFYLSSVDKKTVYLIGIDVPDVTPSEAIIPEPLYQEYNISQEVSEVEYVVTGRTSSWGMSINQVTLFLVIGMVTAIVIVGCVMYGLNKRKLRMGYVPDLDDDEDEE